MLVAVLSSSEVGKRDRGCFVVKYWWRSHDEFCLEEYQYHHYLSLNKYCLCALIYQFYRLGNFMGLATLSSASPTVWKSQWLRRMWHTDSSHCTQATRMKIKRGPGRLYGSGWFTHGTCSKSGSHKLRDLIYCYWPFKADRTRGSLSYNRLR